MVKIPGGVVKIPGMCGYCPRCNSRKVGTYVVMSCVFLLCVTGMVMSCVFLLCITGMVMSCALLVW